MENSKKDLAKMAMTALLLASALPAAGNSAENSTQGTFLAAKCSPGGCGAAQAGCANSNYGSQANCGGGSMHGNSWNDSYGAGRAGCGAAPVQNQTTKSTSVYETESVYNPKTKTWSAVPSNQSTTTWQTTQTTANPNMNPNMRPAGMNPNMNPNMNSNMNSGMDQRMNPNMNSGMNSNMNSGYNNSNYGSMEDYSNPTSDNYPNSQRRPQSNNNSNTKR